MKFLRLVLILFVLLLLPVAIHAQDTTPIATESPLSPLVDLLFPQEVYSEITIALPASQVVRVSVTFTVPNSAALTVVFPQDKAFDFAGEYVVASYSYPIASLTPPDLFSSIGVQWQAVTSDNQVLASDVLEVSYEDERTTWQTTREETPNVTFTLAQNVPLQGQTIINQLKPLLLRLERETGVALTTQYLLYPDNLSVGCDEDTRGNPIIAYSRRFQPQESPCDLPLAQRVFTQSGYTVVQVVNENQFLTQLKINVIDQTYQTVWGTTVVPAWFRYGLQQVYLTTNNNLVGVRQRLRNLRPFTLAQLQTEPTDETQREAWREQAYSLTLYLLDTFGVPDVMNLARNLPSEPDFATAYQTILGQSLDALLLDWETWIFTTRAERAYDYTIYLPVTVTPAPTATFSKTPVPPTITRTPTRTPIPPTPTQTLTRTPVPPTATITPLPAQGFVVRANPTPVPPATAPLQLNTSQQTIVMVVAILVVLIGLIGYGFSRRR